MADDFLSIRHPELVFGIAGPIGIDIDAIVTTLTNALHAVDYKSVPIRLTAEIEDVPSSIVKPEAKDYHSVIKYKMDHTSQLCRSNNDPAWAMRYVIDAIQRERIRNSASAIICEGDGDFNAPFVDVAKEDKILHRVAYIIRQVKRPEEVELLTNVYGKQFVLVSAYASEADRIKLLSEKIKESLPLTTKVTEITRLAEALVIQDMDEGGDDHGQHLRRAFHLADVFIDGLAPVPMREKTERFVNALFGLNEISPTKIEFGMYQAKAASLRSADLSRQVGAAIFSTDGELITQGCNEVPRAFGGTYWDEEVPDFRDIKLGRDPNDSIKRDILRDILERLESEKLLSDKALSLGASGEKLIDALTQKPNNKTEDGRGCLHEALVSDLTEFGRVVHAEMNAICDAARNGTKIKGSVLFCTTFPCHNCTKHILASGISKVYYIEPYPKSRAKEHHYNEVELEVSSPTRVSFQPFLGISPLRYRDIFEKGKRKKSGLAKKWYYDIPSPMVDIYAPNYTKLEAFAVARLFGEIHIPDDINL